MSQLSALRPNNPTAPVGIPFFHTNLESVRLELATLTWMGALPESRGVQVELVDGLYRHILPGIREDTVRWPAATLWLAWTLQRGETFRALPELHLRRPSPYTGKIPQSLSRPRAPRGPCCAADHFFWYAESIVSLATFDFTASDKILWAEVLAETPPPLVPADRALGVCEFLHRMQPLLGRFQPLHLPTDVTHQELRRLYDEALEEVMRAEMARAELGIPATGALLPCRPTIASPTEPPLQTGDVDGPATLEQTASYQDNLSDELESLRELVCREAMVSAQWLAELLNQPVRRVESFLTRLRQQLPDCGVQVDSPRRREPRYLYRTSVIWKSVEAMLPRWRQLNQRRQSS